MPKKKHITPAKIKYDKTHPVVSVRVDQKLKKKLDEVKKLSNKSVGDILREALKVQAPKTKNAFKKGYESAKYQYRIIYKCSVCGMPLEITSEKEKKAAAQYMGKSWAHSSCLEKSKQQAS